MTITRQARQGPETPAVRIPCQHVSPRLERRQCAAGEAGSVREMEASDLVHYPAGRGCRHTLFSGAANPTPGEKFF